MSKCGDTAKSGGPPEGGRKQTKRRTRAVTTAVGGKEPGAAGTISEGTRNERIAAEWRSGRDVSSLAAEYGPKARRIYEIIKQCREGAVEELELDAPWRGQRWADELLVQMQAAVSDAREIELRARAERNTGCELGAFNARMRAFKELTMFLQETGLLKSENEQPPAVSEAQLNDEFDFAWKRWGEMAELGRDEERKYWERKAAELKNKRDAEFPRTHEQSMGHSDGEEDDSPTQS